MAKKTVVKIIDDIDGVELDEFETVRWSLDGKQYNFDTSPAHAEEFRDYVATYVAISRTVKAGARRRGTSTAQSAGASTSEIRVSMAMRKSPLVARSRSPLVAR